MAPVKTGLLTNRVLVYVFVSLLATACYINSLPCGFVFDDVSAIVDNKDVTLESPLSSLLTHDFWGTPITQDRSHKSYRPLCVLTFRLNYLFGGLDPRGYHAVNVLLHVLVTILFLSVCQRLCFVDRLGTSAVAAALFAVHPIHTEAVTGIVGRAELISASFSLLALHAYASSVAAAATGARLRQAASWCLVTSACIFFATFSKEQGITVVGVCAAYDVFAVCQVSWPAVLRWFRHEVPRQETRADDVATVPASSSRHGRCCLPASAWLRIGCLLVTAAAVLAIRLRVMGSELPVFLPFDNPAASAPSPTRQLTYNFLLPLNAWLLLCPSRLLCDWTMGTVPLVRSVADPRNAATVALYAVLLRLCYVALVKDSLGVRRSAVILGLALTVMPFLPASNLLFPVGFVVAERVLYVPSMGYCILLAQGADVARQRLILRSSAAGRIFSVAMLTLLLMFACKTIERNSDWNTERSLFVAALKVTRDNAKVYNNIGHTYEAEGRHDVALVYFRSAARKQLDDIGSHINVGRAFAALEQWAPAEEAYRAALSLMPAVRPGKTYSARVAPSHLAAYVGLANLIAKNASRLLEADKLYRFAISMRPDYVQAYINLGSVLMQLGRHDEAANQYRLALEYGLNSSGGSSSLSGTKTDDIYYNLGVANLGAGRTDDALEYFDKALHINAEHKLSLYNSAVLIQEQPSLAWRRLEAAARLHLLQRLDPANADAFFTQALLATDMGDFETARSNFLSAIQLRNDFRGALFNLALLLVNDLHRPAEAVPYLEQCLRHHPLHVKSHLLLGDIRLTYLNDTAAAEEHFRSVLSIEPGHVQAEHNLCVVLVHREQLAAAARCLEALLPRAPPGATYIAEHLAVVQARMAAIREPAVGMARPPDIAAAQSDAELRSNAAGQPASRASQQRGAVADGGST